jgi:hypothetical protein
MMLKKVARPSLEIINWEDFLSQKLFNLVKKLQMQPKMYQKKHTFVLESQFGQEVETGCIKVEERYLF